MFNRWHRENLNAHWLKTPSTTGARSTHVYARAIPHAHVHVRTNLAFINEQTDKKIVS